MTKITTRKAQLSLEFSILLLAIIVISLITIVNFISQNFTKDDWNIDDIENAAKSAVILVNSGYNGIQVNETLIYGGISWSADNKKNISIYILPKLVVTKDIKDFIKSYIYNNTNINESEYTILINP